MIPKKSESSDDEEEDAVGDANCDVTHDDVTCHTVKDASFLFHIV